MKSPVTKTDHPVTATASEFLLEGDHRVVIYGALKKLHIAPTHHDYEDLVQEGMLFFLRRFEDAPKDSERNCLAYLYRAMNWHFLNYLVRSNRDANYNAPADTTALLEFTPDAASDPATADSFIIYQQLLANCSANEAKYLISSFQEGYTVTQIAAKYGVSRKTVYQWRHHLKATFHKITN